MLPKEIRDAFLNNDFSGLKYGCIRYLEDWLKEFPQAAPKLIDIKEIYLSGASLQNINFDNDIPIGAVIAYASDSVPQGYLRCDGSIYSKDLYPELYDVLHGHDGKFQVPDYRDVFLRGSNHPSEIGQFNEATTGMPKKPFQVLANGIHSHTIHPSGQHNHQSDPAGEHSHKLSAAGDHTHSVTSEGDHHHTIDASGNHDHKIHDNGRHEHVIHDNGAHDHNKGSHIWTLKVDGHYTQKSDDQSQHGNRPNLRDAHPIQSDGLHSHTMTNEGSHSHSMDENGAHDHTMSYGGKHVHTLNKVDSHIHEISLEALHSHNISFAEEHTHDIAESDNHVHEIIGGDIETSPKNRKVAYLIKARPTTISSKQIDELKQQVQALRAALENNPTPGNVACITTIVVGILGLLASRLLRR